MAGNLSYIDLFSGCGGLSLGLHNAGWKGIFAVEKSEDAFETLKFNLINSKSHFNWPSWLPVGNYDINTVLKNYKENLALLNGTVDLVAGGPPCQGFSMAGRRNESDKRNELIKSYIKFIKLVKPKLIFFENVRGFTMEFKKNKEKGKKYSSYVTGALNRAGYQVEGRLINFGEYGVPQKRTRFILVGVRKDIAGKDREKAKSFFRMLTSKKELFLQEKGISCDTNLEDAISDLLKSNGTDKIENGKNFDFGKYGSAMTSFQKIMRASIDKDFPDSHRFPNHKPEIIKKFAFIQDFCRKNKDIDALTRQKFNIKKHTIIPLDKNQKAPTITTLPDDYIHYSEPRILTVREYARIQTFPDDYYFQGKYTTGGKRRVLEVPRYTQIGNAIPPLFAEQSGHILKNLL